MYGNIGMKNEIMWALWNGEQGLICLSLKIGPNFTTMLFIDNSNFLYSFIFVISHSLPLISYYSVYMWDFFD